MSDRTFDAIIAGAGPAGLATALYLLRRRPDLRSRVAAIEKARHPRPKTCAGGLIPKTMLALRELEIELDVPHVEVVHGTAHTPIGSDVDMFRGDTLCTVIRRDEFDALLARAAREAGLDLIENTRVLGIEQDSGSVRVTTDGGTFEPAIVVGADGSGSRVRTSVFGQRKESIGRALMTDVPAAAAPEFIERRYIFDFRCVAAGVGGYSWAFPCLIDGRPHLNVGIYEQRPRHDGSNGAVQSSDNKLLFDQLCASFPGFGLDRIGRREMPFKSFPIRWFDPSDRYVERRVILAGDAAGVDPLMGEGISTAFEHGRLAAGAIADFLDGKADALKRYDAELHRSAIGRKLEKLAFAARSFYGPHYRAFFRIAMVSRSAQAIGVDWFNGSAHLDELSTPTLLARWARAILFNTPVR
ncbi:MAG TPA: geranylgeranyl reductase family protein [Candidatus Binataceae bacterium]|nr:geranylgeranyl reductase family protein [Candidatus Binataceae bacterium]